MAPKGEESDETPTEDFDDEIPEDGQSDDQDTPSSDHEPADKLTAAQIDRVRLKMSQHVLRLSEVPTDVLRQLRLDPPQRDESYRRTVHDDVNDMLDRSITKELELRDSFDPPEGPLDTDEDLATDDEIMGGTIARLSAAALQPGMRVRVKSGYRTDVYLGKSGEPGHQWMTVQDVRPVDPYSPTYYLDSLTTKVRMDDGVEREFGRDIYLQVDSESYNTAVAEFDWADYVTGGTAEEKAKVIAALEEATADVWPDSILGTLYQVRIGQSFGDSLAHYSRKDDEIVVNPNTIASWDEAKHSSAINRGWFAGTGKKLSPLAYGLAHELGHMIHFSTKYRRGVEGMRPVIEGIAKRVGVRPLDNEPPDRFIARNRTEILTHIGVYASSNENELVAELWAAYIDGEINPATQAVHDYLVGEHA